MSITSAQEAALQQLWAITASTTDSAKQRDERLLQENGWNVEATVEQIFAGNTEPTAQPTAPPAGPSRSGSTSSTSNSFQIDDSLGIRPPPGSRRLSGSAVRRQGSTGLGAGTGGAGLWGMIGWPIRVVFGVISSVWYFFIRTFIPLSFLPRLPRFLLPPSGLAPPSSTSRNLDPTSTSLSFVRDLEQFTGCSATTNSLPEFWIGPYREFLTFVRKEGKVGLVVLVCGEHEDDEEFKRDVLCDNELVRVLKEKDVMVWGADVRTREGYQVSQTLLATTYPALTFLSLLPPSPQSASSSSAKLSVLTVLSGPPSTTTSASSIIQTLTTSVLPRATPFLNRLKRERLTLAEARHLRQEQDRAFEEASRKDREKMERQKQEKELERLKVERAQRELQEKEKRIRDRKDWRRYARKHLLPPSSGPIRIALRTPLSAERNVRNFEATSSTISLFVYAETLLIPSGDSPDSDPDTPPEGYEPEWDFRIVTTYPRKEIERVDSGGEAVWQTIKSAGGALFAEKIEGGAWADAELRALNGEESDDEVLDED